MIYGFTGTQKGMSDQQAADLRRLLVSVCVPDEQHEFHHGDCVGADAEAAVIAHELGFWVVCHPPKDPKKRAFTTCNDLVLPVADYRVRNNRIVYLCEVLIACPLQDNEVKRSGTWMTIRMADSLGRMVIQITR